MHGGSDRRADAGSPLQVSDLSAVRWSPAGCCCPSRQRLHRTRWWSATRRRRRV